MSVSSTAILNTTTSVFLFELDDSFVKTLVLSSNTPLLNQLTEGRILHIKATQSTIGMVKPGYIQCSTGVTLFLNLPNRPLNPNYCVTLQEYPANTYSLLNYYTNTVSFSVPSPLSLAINVPGNTSFLFVDLLTQSKTLVLPPITSLTTCNSNVPYFMIKDVYGNAAFQPMYVSTSGSDSLDGLGNSIRIIDNYSAVELVGDKTMNRWHILNYYNGSL